MTRDVIATARPIVHDGLMPTAYAIAHLHDPTVNADVVTYIERIQDSMDPFGGRFLVHGPQVEVLEGAWPGSIVILEFPSVDAARGWYESPAYREILHLRTDHIAGDAIIVEGVPDSYDPRQTAAMLRAQLSS